MLFLVRLLRWPILLLIATGLACALVPFRAIATSLVGNEYGDNNNPGGGSCAAVGVYDPANPFTGWPVQNGDWSHVTATFCDPYYLQQFGTIHWGLDLGYPIGYPVLASAAQATVTQAEWGHPSKGNHIKACTTNGWCAAYFHLNDIYVTVGEAVTGGYTIGAVGSTGNSTGPHLHFEVTDPGHNRVDPAPSLP